jgi:hypothetical protein
VDVAAREENRGAPRAAVADDDFGSEAVERCVERGGCGEAAVGHDGNQRRREHHDRYPDRGREVLAGVELELAATDATAQAALRVDPFGMELLQPPAGRTPDALRERADIDRVEREEVRRAARAAHAEARPGARSFHSGTPYECCKEIETAVPIRTSTVEA